MSTLSEKFAAALVGSKIRRTPSSLPSALISRDQILSLTDQAIVSATAFLTTVLIARWSDPTQLGIYALGLSLILSLLGFQDSLILQPFLIQRHYPEGSPAERAGVSLALSMLFTAASVSILVVAALGFLELGGGSQMALVTLVLAATAPFALTRDFARRFSVARLETGRVLVLDSTAAIIQLSLLIWLGGSGRMSALSAYAALGAACALPTAVWLYYARAEFSVRRQPVRLALKRNWAFEWLLAGGVTKQLQQYVVYWLAAFIGGVAVTGLYAACMSIVGIANPLIVGLSNVFMPKAVLAWKHGGGPRLRHEAIRNEMLIAAIVVPFTLALVLAGETMMRFLYPGTGFAGLDYTLAVLGAATSAKALGFPATSALAAMERPRAIATIGVLEAVLTVSLVCTLMMQWGLLGAAYGLLAGGVAGTVGRWLAFYLRTRKAYDDASVVRVLKELTNISNDGSWTIMRLGEGHEAEVFMINSSGRSPLWRTHHTLIAKIYKPQVLSNLAEITTDSVQAQFDSLSKRHAALDGRQINGWRISVPRPLYISRSPLALVMTAVPGQALDSYTSKTELLPPLLDAARAVAMSMEECWSNGQRYGDLGLHNVLLDVERKQISFIDAEDAGANDASNQATAAWDLANLVNGVAMDVTDLSNAKSRICKELFAEGILLAIIKGTNPRSENQRLLNEVWSCVQQQLANYADESWSPRGAWHRFVRFVAIFRIRSILRRVGAQIDVRAAKSEFEIDPAIPLRGNG